MWKHLTAFALMMFLSACAISTASAFNDNIHTSEDTYVDSGNATGNFGSETFLNMNFNWSGLGNETWLFLKFSGINAYSLYNITNIDLCLYHSREVNDGVFNQHTYNVSNQTWGESVITWSNHPVVGALIDNMTFGDGQIILWSDIGYEYICRNVTAYVQTHILGEAENVSFMFNSTHPDMGVFSSEFGSNYPYLLISYELNTSNAAHVNITTPLGEFIDTDISVSPADSVTINVYDDYGFDTYLYVDGVVRETPFTATYGVGFHDIMAYVDAQDEYSEETNIVVLSSTLDTGGGGGGGGSPAPIYINYSIPLPPLNSTLALQLENKFFFASVAGPFTPFQLALFGSVGYILYRRRRQGKFRSSDFVLASAAVALILIVSYIYIMGVPASLVTERISALPAALREGISNMTAQLGVTA